MTIAIYSRKSKFTGKGDSIANQIEMCRQRAQQYLSAKGIPEADAKILVYEDEGFSGKNMDRPQFQRMLKEIRLKKFEYIEGSAPLDMKAFEEQKKVKLQDFDKMVEYLSTNGSRMKFLCDYLGDETTINYRNCDNTGEKKLSVMSTPEITQKLAEFFKNFSPVLEVGKTDSNLKNGVAGSLYSAQSVGKTISRCKYETHEDYPDFIFQIVEKAFHKHLSKIKYDLLLYVPSASSGDIMRNFAIRLAGKLKINISHNLAKSRQTTPQRELYSSISKKDNVKNAFVYQPTTDIYGQKILLIDDIFDSGNTIKEVGKMLTRLGAEIVVPLTIAKTVFGDKI
jgi:ATP-dependent DNA helicase RecQ